MMDHIDCNNRNNKGNALNGVVCSQPLGDRVVGPATPQEEQQEEDETQKQQKRPLGIVFDIDGTLIAESEDVVGVIIRPDAVEFLKWCLQKGHRLAIWTAASESWADFVTKKLCQLVHDHTDVNDDDCRQPQPEQCNRLLQKHKCTGSSCRKTFDFVWVGDDMKKMNRSAIPVASKQGHCAWCDFYSHTCQECSCHYGAAECDCRWTKDLRKIWDLHQHNGNHHHHHHQQQQQQQLNHPGEEAVRYFTQERTLLIENTPQRCRLNYGNAIYVPTYEGGPTEKRGDIFQALQRFVQEELEDDDIDVRRVAKCHHNGGPHACFEQSWWPKQEREDGDEEWDSDNEQDMLDFEFQMFDSFRTHTITLSCWDNQS